jgi:uncharacterized protein YjbJ (UPF0337 family)
MSNTGDQDKLEGKAKELGGRVQQAAGDLTDDADLKARGEATETEGKAQGFVGGVKNTVNRATDKVLDKLNEVTDDHPEGKATRNEGKPNAG